MLKLLANVAICSILGVSSFCFSKDIYWDILPNPHFNTGVSPTDAVIQLKGLKVEKMENLIKNECKQFSGYINQSITNWDLARYGHKSAIEAQQYSHQLALDILYPQLNMFSFPFGLRTYLTADEAVKKIIFDNKNKQGIDQQNYVNQIYSQCVFQMGPEKYYSLMTNEKLERGNEKSFDYTAFEAKRDKSKSTISLDDSIPVGSKQSQAGIIQKLKISDLELQALRIFIENDVKTSVKNENETWFLYQAINEKKQRQLNEFLTNGGKNIEFARLIGFTIMLSETNQGFKNFNFIDSDEFGEQANQAIENMDENLERLGNTEKNKFNRMSTEVEKLGYSLEELFQ